MSKTIGETMKWLIGVALTLLSPLILSVIILWALVWKLPLTVYDIAHEIYERMTEKKYDGIDWYK